MHWLYRLQHRLAITPAEGTALFTLTVLFLLGLGALRLQGRPPAVDESPYAAADRLFADAEPTADATAPSGDAASAPADSIALRLDLNTAPAAALEALPRIGPKTAARIVAHRERHGPFRRVRDLTAVPGIGEKTLERLAPFVFVDG